MSGFCGRSSIIQSECGCREQRCGCRFGASHVKLLKDLSVESMLRQQQTLVCWDEFNTKEAVWRSHVLKGKSIGNGVNKVV